jgi:hypothetical protein
MLISALKSIFTAFIDLIIISLNIISTIANQWEIITTIELFFYLVKARKLVQPQSIPLLKEQVSYEGQYKSDQQVGSN